MSRHRFTGTQGDSEARRTAAADPPATPGKQTRVEQLHAGVVQQRASGEPGSSDVHAAAARGVATPSATLPHGETIQRLFGRHDISSIRAHTGPDAAASARDMGAAAYATGDHVVLGGNADLHTAAHEAAHVVQQRGGVQLKGGVGAVGDPYERHADEVADRVVRGESAEPLLDAAAGGSSAGGAASAGAVQRVSINPATEFGAARADNNVKASISNNAMHGFGTTVNATGWHTKVTFDPLVTPGAQDGVQLAAEGSGVTAIVGPDHPYGSQPSSASAAQNNRDAQTLRGGTPHVAAHILNDQIGGPGVAQNLFAFPGTANTLMESQVESKMKAAVQAGHYIHYRGVVRHPARGPADQITMSWNKLDQSGNDIGGGQSNTVIPFGGAATNQAVVAQGAAAAAQSSNLLHPASPTEVKNQPWGPFQMPDPKQSVVLEYWLNIDEFPAVGSKEAFEAYLTANRSNQLGLQGMLQSIGRTADYRAFGRWLSSSDSRVTIRPRAGRGISQADVDDLMNGTTTTRPLAFIAVVGSSDYQKVIPFAASLLHKAARATARSRI